MIVMNSTDFPTFTQKQKKESHAEKTYREVEEVMKKITTQPFQNSYSLTAHLEKLNEDEINNLITNIKEAAKKLGVAPNQFVTAGDKVAERINQIGSRTTRTTLDEELLKNSKVLLGDVKLAHEAFTTAKNGVNQEIVFVSDKNSFDSFKDALKSYQKIEKIYSKQMIWIENHYNKLSLELKVRELSDPEKNPPKPTIDTMAFCYRLDSVQTHQDLEAFHKLTELVSSALKELTSTYTEMKTVREEFGKRFCYFAYLCAKGIRPGSRSDNFEKEYVKGKHHYLNQLLRFKDDFLIEEGEFPTIVDDLSLDYNYESESEFSSTPRNEIIYDDDEI